LSAGLSEVPGAASIRGGLHAACQHQASSQNSNIAFNDDMTIPIEMFCRRAQPMRRNRR
jgi:hypothetical protein